MSHTDVRIVFTVIAVLILDPINLSILFNFWHRKKMVQLQLTMIMWIIFVINNAEDGSFGFKSDLMYKTTDFPEREKEPWILRTATDAFYGFSKVRGKGLMMKVCYLLFDLVLYPNSVYFTLMVLMFFLLIVIILFISLLNHIGWTHIDLDQYAAREVNARNGLTQNEMKKIAVKTYISSRPPRDNADLNASNLSDSEVMCSICYGPFNRASEVSALPNCGHLYHSSCITEWFKAHCTCPICRLDIKALVKEEDNQNSFLNRSMFEIADI